MIFMSIYIFIIQGVMVWLYTTESYIIPNLRNLSRVQCFFAWSVVRYGHHWQSNLIQMISLQFRFLRRFLKKVCESWDGCLRPIELYHNRRSRKSLASVTFAANLFASHLDPVTPSLECAKCICRELRVTPWGLFWIWKIARCPADQEEG